MNKYQTRYRTYFEAKFLGLRHQTREMRNYLNGPELPADKDLKKLGRGSHASRTDAKSGLSVTKWLDNKAVQVITNFF